MADTSEDLFYLKDDEIELPSENGDIFNAEMLESEDDDMSSGDEDLNTLTANVAMSNKLETSYYHIKEEESKPAEITESISGGGEVIEDFVRNFLVKMGMIQTLHNFQTEWYELLVKGKLNDQHKQTVPDVYTQNQMLNEQNKSLKQQLEGYKEAARLAKEKYVRMKKERDFHRMHHRRTTQEKEKLIVEVKRLKEHFSSYEPMLTTLKSKYEAATRDKMLTKLERDKVMAELECLHSTLYSLRPTSRPSNPSSALTTANNTSARKSLPIDRSQPLPPIQDNKQEPHPHQTKQQQNNTLHNKLHSLPVDVANPYTTTDQPLCTHLSRVGGFQLTGTINAHEYPISCLSLHPTKSILATGSDDHTWRLWAVPSGELLMTGEGHEDWVSRVKFHPNGDLLASCGGDGIVKIWNFSKLSSVISLEEHRQPVWGCSWHWNGSLIASCGMDNTTRLWDIESVKCILTLRGHTDSVNSVQFVPYSNTVISCSADKTVMLWDARTGLCTHSLTNHENACNEVTSNWQGDRVFSGDCFGFVMCWDSRAVGNSPLKQWDVGPHPVNGLDIDRAGSVLACASGSGEVFMVQTDNGQVTNLPSSDKESVEASIYGHNSDILYSVGANGMISVWQ